MAYIVMDLEFNQAFDFETGHKTHVNPDCRFEIIQIGILKLDKNFQALEQSNFLIKPQIYTRIHPYVSKMTGLTMDILKNEKTFPEIFNCFVEFINSDLKKDVFCFWGSTDMKMLYKNIEYYKLDDSALTKNYTDVQRLANTFFKHDSGKCIGLKSAVETFKIETRYPFHNAFYDAFYTSEILKAINPDKMTVIKYQKTQKLSKRKKKKHFKGASTLL